MFKNNISCLIKFIPGCFDKVSAVRFPQITQRHKYASFSARDVLHETSDEAGTLTATFAKYIAIKRHKDAAQTPTIIRYADYFPIADIRSFQRELQKTPADQVAALVIFTSTYRPNAEPQTYAKVLNDIDSIAVKLLPQMHEDVVLRTLYAFLFLMPNWITRLDFYKAALNRLATNNEQHNESTNKSLENFVQSCFYLGLSKKNMSAKANASELLQNLLKQRLENHLDNMHTLDFAIICNAIYKTATSVNFGKFNQRVIKEVLKLDIGHGQDGILINYLKLLRFLRVRSATVCEYLTAICKNSDSLAKLQIRGQVHLFAYLAECLWDNEECSKPIIELFFKNLLQPRRFEFHSEAVRSKDLCTFLWCCAQMNCPLTSEQLRHVENHLFDKLKQGEFENYPDQLVDCCLSLWILGYKSKELLERSLHTTSTAKSSKRAQPKVDNRLTVLMSASQIEQPSWCFELLKGFKAYDIDDKVPNYLLKCSDFDLKELSLKWSQEGSVETAQIVCPIAGINIPSIHIKTRSPDSKISDSKVLVELLSESQTLHFSKEPIAIVRLKLRLLQALNQKVAMITTKHLSENLNIKDIVDNADDEKNLMEQKTNSIQV
uniref:FAST kinase leucine-rich domain-containing protein n=1 Tax=Glossina palpalis gambiensis TaxID=67801 RepID=A0A1B0C1C7_9MUSC